MDNLNNILKQYDYHLPPELIAQTPAKPRDSARLLVYNRQSQKISYDKFMNLGKYLPKNSVLVFNQTKVWPARLIAQKSTGGKIQLLYTAHDKNYIHTLANKHLAIGSKGRFYRGRDKTSDATFTVSKKSGQFYFLKCSFPISQIPKIIRRYGITPLPPYIKNSPLTEKQRREQYQTVFAKTGLSVAAPTASLHFTKKLMTNLKKQGNDIKFVQLDVGLGTFAPLRDENLKTDKLHREFYKIDKITAAFLNRAKAQGRDIIAVGTTVARTLESASARSKPGRDGSSIKHHKLAKLTGTTDLFIHDNYQFKFIDGLITNFHVPKSSLLMLVSAFAGRHPGSARAGPKQGRTGRKKILSLYQQAIKKKFRFFSFGDGMLIL